MPGKKDQKTMPLTDFKIWLAAISMNILNVIQCLIQNAWGLQGVRYIDKW